MTEYLNKSIDILDFSERTRRSLLRFGIKTTNDLWFNRNIFQQVRISSKIQGIGKKGFAEIQQMLNLISYEFINSNFVENEFPDYGDYGNMKFYIPTEVNKVNGKLSKKDMFNISKVKINEYLYTIYSGTTKFKLNELIGVYVDSLSELQTYILQYRLLFISNNQQITLREVSESFGVTHERVRQIEKTLLKSIMEIFRKLSTIEACSLYLIELLQKNDIIDYGILDFSDINIQDDKSITPLFYSYIHTHLLYKDHEVYYLNREHKLGKILLIYKKDIINKIFLETLFVNIDKLYIYKRPEDKKYMKDLLICEIAKNNLEEFINNNGYEYGIIQYLGYAYNIFELKGNFIFPKNKKDIIFLVKKELESLEQPIHFSDMYEKMMNKYPDYKRNKGKVHSALIKCSKNVGLGLYVKQSHEMYGGTIGDIAEEYLENNGIPILFSDLSKFILSNRIAQKSSLGVMLFDQDKDKRFVKIEGNKIGLRKRNCIGIVNSRKTYNYDEEVYSFLKNNRESEYTVDEILSNIGSDKIYHAREKLRYALNKLTKKGKITYYTKGLLNYYYIL